MSFENLFASWKTFRGGKRAKPDVQEFERHLEANLLQLQRDLRLQRYRHGPYTPFTITDPKVRYIHKATVGDRIVHHALYRVVMPVFEPRFIYDSYSCRVGKGTHAAVTRLEWFTWQVRRNSTQQCWALKCDVRKFFDSVDHAELLKLLFWHVPDDRTRWLLREIVGSYTVTQRELKGIPIGNLTSQLFANVYLNELDQFIKHQLRVRYYLRYTDDFVLLHEDPAQLQSLIPWIEQFLAGHLKLSLHPKKVILRKLSRGIDFLGYVVLPHHRVLRTRTKRRMLNRITPENLTSYLGMLKHCNGFRLAAAVEALAASTDETSTAPVYQEGIFR